MTPEETAYLTIPEMEDVLRLFALAFTLAPTLVSDNPRLERTPPTGFAKLLTDRRHICE